MEGWNYGIMECNLEILPYSNIPVFPYSRDL